MSLSRSTRTVVGAPLAIVLALCVVILAGAAPAYAESPWWHLTSLSRPSYLQPGQGKDEVQEVQLSSGEGYFVLSEAERPSRYALLSASASAGEVQHALEAEVYGAKNVKVSAAQGPVGGRAFRITFVGELEDQWLRLVEATSVEGAAVSVSESVRGRPDGVIVVNAVNLGDADVDPAVQTVTLSDTLPAGVKALAIEGTVSEGLLLGFNSDAPKLECARASLSCVFTGKIPPGEKEALGEYPSVLAPYEQIQARIAVKLTGAKSGDVSEADITGGGAPPAGVKQPLTVSSTPTPFGVSSYEMRPEEAGGGAAAQAGSHPFQLTTTLMLNQTLEAAPVALPKDLHFKLPPGLIGNPEPFARCTLAQFLTVIANGNACSTQTVVGVARVFVHGEQGRLAPGDQSTASGSDTDAVPITVPLFNLEPEVGEPARFGFVVVVLGEFVPVLLDTAVRTGGDYGVTVTVRNITQVAGLIGSEVTFWGVPGDPRHDKSRGRGCLATGLELSAECPPFESNNPPPLLSLPTSCTGPLLTSVEADSWAEPGVFQSVGSSEPLPAMDGCNRLPFAPSIKVTPDGTAGSTPTGLNVDVHVPQDLTLNPSGLSESEVKNITVALPEGVAIDPAGGDGLEACSEGQIGFGGTQESPLEPGIANPVFPAMLPGGPGSSEALVPGVNFCPNASKIGTVTIHTPLLPNALTGDVYLAAQEANPFGSLVAMYIVAQDPVSGTVVKLTGVVHLTPSGQIVATFEDNPQLPFEDAELHFFGGERAPLTSPARCGAYTTQASYTPWSGNGVVGASSIFDMTSGPHGSPCPGASLPFNPNLTAGTTSIQAGGFSPFTMTMSREDGQQTLQAISLHMPQGVSGLLSGVELCPEPQADQGTCGPNSQIGETTVGVGVGGDPFTVTGGKVFITGPYKGAPFGLSIVNPAKAGPFDLEHTSANHPACDCLVVRAKIEVDPITAQLTVTSDNEGLYQIPTSLEGIPLQIKHVNVTINRPGFTFNPTNCNPAHITGGLSSIEGGTAALSVPFQATNCAVLGFKPGFKVSASGKTSRQNGASLKVKLTYPKAPFGSQANIKSVKVDLPKQLPSRLTTLQQACTSAQFQANPAGCPAASIVGHATATTPLIPVSLTGPAYFVSYGGAKFPELVIVLQGYGVTLDLHGETFINKEGITSSTFHTIPDAPVGSFELTLPEGQYSALAANGNLCAVTKTVLVKKKVTVKSKGHAHTVTRKVKQTTAGSLVMPTSFVAQNGAEIHQNTPIEVTGCAKKAKAKKARRLAPTRASENNEVPHRDEVTPAA
jgi:hypothetical protein